MTELPERTLPQERSRPEGGNAHGSPPTRRRGFFSALRRYWGRGGVASPERSKLFPDLPPYSGIPEVPDDHPRVGWLPEGYRRVYVARGANSGFQVPDEISRVFAHPKIEGGGRTAMQVYSTYTPDALLAGAHLNWNPGPTRRTSLIVAGQSAEVEYHDGQFRRSDRGPYVADSGRRFRWGRENQHSLVVAVGNLRVGIRAARLAGVDEFHLYAMAESLILPRGLE